MVRPIVQHMAALAEAAEVAGRIVGGIVVKVRGAQCYTGETRPAQLSRFRQSCAPAASIPPAQQRVVEPAPVRQAGYQHPCGRRHCSQRPAARCSPASRPLRDACGDGLRPALTQAARDDLPEHGRGRETALNRTEKRRHDRRDGNPGLYFLIGGNKGLTSGVIYPPLSGFGR
jgi:hypothetical protein